MKSIAEIKAAERQTHPTRIFSFGKNNLTNIVIQASLRSFAVARWHGVRQVLFPIHPRYHDRLDIKSGCRSEAGDLRSEENYFLRNERIKPLKTLAVSTES